MTPIFPEENGEVVLRGIQVLWFALFNQGIMLVTVLFLSWLDSRRGRDERVSGWVPPKPENFSAPKPVVPPRGR